MAGTYVNKRDGKTVLLQPRLNEASGRPIVIADEQRYDAMSDLLIAHPELASAEQLPVFCRLLLHFHPGPGCMPIEDPGKFRARYAALVRYGMENPGGISTTADFGPFDVSEISEPKVANDTLIFYAEEMLHNVPYRVEVPWPYRKEEKVKFLLLPLEE